LLSRRPKENDMAEPRKPRQASRAPAKGKSESRTPPAAAVRTESKAAAEFERFKAARAAAEGATTGTTPSSTSTGATGLPPPMTGLPPWAMPPSFSLPQPPQGWGAMLPQPGIVQPAPVAVGSIGDRLGSTLRLGIDVINMALAGSLRLLGGYSGHAQHGYGGQCGCGGHSGAGHCGGHDCCHVFEHDACCTPSVGNCCD
jgi:hypothetical protein